MKLSQLDAQLNQSVSRGRVPPLTTRASERLRIAAKRQSAAHRRALLLTDWRRRVESASRVESDCDADSTLTTALAAANNPCCERIGLEPKP